VIYLEDSDEELSPMCLTSELHDAWYWLCRE